MRRKKRQGGGHCRCEWRSEAFVKKSGGRGDVYKEWKLL